MQQREERGTNNLKTMREQIKTVVRVTSCNLVMISQQVPRGASCRSQILEGSSREKK